MSINLSKENVILAVFFAIALAYLVWVVYKTYFLKHQEHFTTEDLSDYQARMTVMKVFDTVLHRKPVPDEINKYAAITNEQDMLVAVLADFNVITSGPAAVSNAAAEGATSSVTSESTTESFAPTVTPAPLPVIHTQATTPVIQEDVVVAPRKKVPLDLLAVEKSLAHITDSVNSIRGLLYAQTMCEGS